MIDDPGEPPEFRYINPMMLNNRELLEVHHKLAEWVDDAESSNDPYRPPEQLIDDVRNALSSVSEERALRRTM
jgi:hypothetical protein